ncbi:MULTISPECIES: IS1595 family transposase [Massilia]|uniref:IS1595 family transposase n=1 Tax=Massilia TaxID=149698 RepID=UPI001C631384|nr:MULTISPECIES: IS1595 family transposase [Massilia]QYG02905.1 IS1595 family transposase [Massilia sp. NP310]
MDSLDFDTLFAALRGVSLDLQERSRLRAWLATVDDAADAVADCIALIEQAAIGKCCPRCGGARSHRCGQASGLQRWRCLACGRSYNALSGTPLAHLRKKEHWLDYLQCLLDSRTVRASADAVQVHRTTSFRWRHRMVAGFIHERAARLGGVVEADETYLLESQKGSRKLTRPPRQRGGVARHRGVGRDHDCQLVACERDGPTLDFHCGRGPVSLAELDQCLGPVLAPDAWLISDGAAAYRAFAKHHGIRHEAINLRAGERARGAVHLNHVNGWHSRFKRWLARFNGVASRYLAHYSGWRRVLDVGSPATPHQLLKAAVKAD